MQGRHLLGLRETSPDEIRFLLEAAAAQRGPSSVRGRRVALLFFDTDTRMRIAFERACRRLELETVSMPVGREDVVTDVVKTAASLDVDALVIRHPRAGVPWLAARTFDGAVVNAGDGANEHPCRGLLDLLTLRARRPRLEGARVAIVGDVARSAAGRSFAFGVRHLGGEVTLVGPPTMVPEVFARAGFRISVDLDDVLNTTDGVYLLPLPPDGPALSLYPSVSEYVQRFGVDEGRLERLTREVIVLHPGPVGREALGELGLEALADRQVRDAVDVCAAVLESALGGHGNAVAA